MRSERRRRGFEPAGRIGPEELGLPRKRARELLLAVAWRRVAGGELAARAEALRVSRGVLEVEAREPGVAETLRAILPDLAGRIATDYPSLGVRKCRVLEAGAEGPRSRPLDIKSPAPSV